MPLDHPAQGVSVRMIFLCNLFTLEYICRNNENGKLLWIKHTDWLRALIIIVADTLYRILSLKINGLINMTGPTT